MTKRKAGDSMETQVLKGVNLHYLLLNASKADRQFHKD